MAVVYASTNKRMSRLKGLRPVMDAAAAGILAKAKTRAAQHRLTGNYSANLKVKRKGVDRLVIADDPASTIIEMGHLTTQGKWVAGQHILMGAVYG